ncbi:MAG: glycosidase, partial [Deltaproteobacteria bacterium]|nr:glycosidase [Deltaproteobacteria bacterium]
RVIGRLRQPLLAPESNEREGYVPNVVYSCGSLVHRGQLVLPFAISDRISTIASVSLDELLSALLSRDR